MKTWTRTFGTALTLAWFTGCTVTVGDGTGDDSDDIDFSDKSEEPETTEEETTAAETTGNDRTTEESETSTSAATTDEDDETTANETPTSEPAASSTANETSSNPDTTSEPAFNACNPEPEEDACNACVKKYCEADWEACCGDEECMAQWTALYGCMQDDPSDNPWSDFDNCSAGVSPTGDALDLHNIVQYITSCVNAEYMGEPDDVHNEGEGTCTLDCYNLPTLGDPE